MPRLIAFIFCLAVLAFAGSVKLGLALLAAVLVLLAGWLAWGVVRLFIDPRP